MSTRPPFAAVLMAAGAVALAAACGGTPSLVPDEPMKATPVAPDSFLVEFETTEGPVRMMAYREWSPAKVDRFHDLLRRGYYDDIVIFRVVDDYVAQFGLHGTPEVTAAWRRRGIPDEPVVAANERGRVSFARGGPETRSVQLFINLSNNSPRLDTLLTGGVGGYPPIGEVVSGMEAVDRFEAKYGNEPATRQDSIAQLGNPWLTSRYPDLDRILTARIVESWQ